MVLAAGIVGFILGVNVGFLFAGLMRVPERNRSRRERNRSRRKMKTGHAEDE